ncbi:MAG: EAL domain-containing protein [Nitrospirae bacterium]|nr:EAL domain-containing protein [Nitrospirota bacterium]
MNRVLFQVHHLHERTAPAPYQDLVQRLEAMLDAVEDGVLATDDHGTVELANRAAQQLWGYGAEEMAGKSLDELLENGPAHRLPLVGGTDGPEFAGHAFGTRLELSARRKSGDAFSAEVRIVPSPGACPSSYHVTVRDLTQARRSTGERLEAEERYALALRGADDGLWDWNLMSDTLYLCPRWKAMLGYDENEMGSTPDEWFSRIHPEDVYWVRAGLDAALKGGQRNFESEYRMVHRDGSFRWVLCRGIAVRDSEGRPVRVVGSQTDVTSRRVHDPLTGLPNRTLFADRLARLLARGRQGEGYPCAVLFLDLDRFKVVNDSLGHAAGDQLLVEIARRLETCLRPHDTVARLGGDEFTILLDDIRHAGDALRVAERIHQALASPFRIGPHELFASASIGIALSRGRDDRADDLIRDADTAMYRAKARGGARHEVFDSLMRARAVERLQTETQIRRALEHQQFVLRYSPVTTLDTRECAGLQAQLHWRNPERGLQAPAAFVPIAEEIGLARAIGLWSVRTACRQARDWRLNEAPGPVFISLRFSGRRLAQIDLAEDLDKILAETGMEAKLLRFEISENMIMENPDQAATILERLTERGLRVMIDSFGTGYSSLSYLHRFPIQGLKIDPALVGRVDIDEESAEMVRTIAMLARALSLEVVADGVETQAHATKLLDLGCRYAQGRFFSEPLDAPAAGELITASSASVPLAGQAG